MNILTLPIDLYPPTPILMHRKWPSHQRDLTPIDKNRSDLKKVHNSTSIISWFGITFDKCVFKSNNNT